jgi:hypothetical protein
MNSTSRLLLPLFAATLAGPVGILTALANTPPTLSPIPNITINENAGNQTVDLSGIGPGAAEEDQTVTITALCNNPDLIPNPTITYTSPNDNGSLSFKPATNAFGTAIISVIVNDGQASDNMVIRSFLVTVTSVNDSPVISPIPNQTMNENTAIAIAFTVADAETAASSLVVSAVSSSPALVPLANIVIGGSGTNRVLTVIPAPNEFGTATITVVTSDGSGGTGSRSFIVTVNAVMAIGWAGNEAVVRWTATNGVLQQCGEFGGLWEDMPSGPTSPYRVSPTGIKFYRLRHR